MQDCSIPYTYNGELEHSCITNMTGVTTDCDPLGCLVYNRTPALCFTPKSRLYYCLFAQKNCAIYDETYSFHSIGLQGITRCTHICLPFTTRDTGRVDKEDYNYRSRKFASRASSQILSNKPASQASPSGRIPVRRRSLV